MWPRRRNNWTRQHRQRRLGVLIVPAITAVFLSYFGFHAYHGEYGIYSRYKLAARTAVLQAELDEVRGERMQIERRVQLLQDGTLEKDMLDEQARRALNLSRADEVIILKPFRQPSLNQTQVN